MDALVASRDARGVGHFIDSGALGWFILAEGEVFLNEHSLKADTVVIKKGFGRVAHITAVTLVIPQELLRSEVPPNSNLISDFFCR